MTDKNDGGTAFPVSSANVAHPKLGGPGRGMSLRDWFAGQALAGLFANSSDAFLLAAGREADERREARVTETYTRLAYEAADAMLAERAKR